MTVAFAEDDPFPMPSRTITFIGGPECGESFTEEAAGINFDVWPEWIEPHSGDGGRYYRLTYDELPYWLVNPPEPDVFDAYYVWGPLYNTEAGYVSA